MAEALCLARTEMDGMAVHHLADLALGQAADDVFDIRKVDMFDLVIARIVNHSQPRK